MGNRSGSVSVSSRVSMSLLRCDKTIASTRHVLSNRVQGNSLNAKPLDRSQQLLESSCGSNSSVTRVFLSFLFLFFLLFFRFRFFFSFIVEHFSRSRRTVYSTFLSLFFSTRVDALAMKWQAGACVLVNTKLLSGVQAVSFR